MTNEIRNLTVAAAAKTIAGPAPVGGSREDYARYNAELHAAVLEVIDEANNPRSLTSQLLERLDECRSFVSPELVSVRKEEATERVVITLRRDRPDEDGNMEESIRTNRFDDFLFGGPARSLANRAKKYIGHRVVVTIRNETLAKNSNRKARVIENIRSLGPARDDED